MHSSSVLSTLWFDQNHQLYFQLSFGKQHLMILTRVPTYIFENSWKYEISVKCISIVMLFLLNAGKTVRHSLFGNKIIS